jgi:hypothetical protein
MAPFNDVDAPLVLSSGRTLSVQVQQTAEGKRVKQVVLIQTSAEGSANLLDLDDHRADSSNAEPQPAAIPAMDTDDVLGEHSAANLAQGGDQVVSMYPLVGGRSVGTVEMPRPHTPDVETDGSLPSHPFGSKAHIDALLSSLHEEENSSPTGSSRSHPESHLSPGVSPAVAHRKKIEAKLKRQKLVRDMLELAVAEQAKKERRKARLTMPGGRFLPSDDSISPDPPAGEGNPVKVQTDVWVRTQELIGERQKGQRVARALIESFEPVQSNDTAGEVAATTAATVASAAAVKVDANEASAHVGDCTVKGNIAATEAWHLHGDGLDYAAIDIPELPVAADTHGSDAHNVSCTPRRSASPRQASSTETSNREAEGDVSADSSSTGPSLQAVATTIARDKVLQKRAQVEVQQMLARIREKTKSQASTSRSITALERKDATKSTDSAREQHKRTNSGQEQGVSIERDGQEQGVSMQATWLGAPEITTDMGSSGSAIHTATEHSLVLQQKARGQVQEMLTKIKRQAKQQVSPTKRTHAIQRRGASRTGVRESFGTGTDTDTDTGTDQCRDDTSSTAWPSTLAHSPGEVRSPVCKTRKSQPDLDSQNARTAQMEPAFVSRHEALADTILDDTHAAPSWSMSNAKKDCVPASADRYLADENQMDGEHRGRAFQQAEQTYTCVQQPGAPTSVPDGDDAATRQQPLTDVMTRERENSGGIRHQGLSVHSDRKKQRNPTQDPDKTASPTRRHSPTNFARLSPTNSVDRPADSVEELVIKQHAIEPRVPEAPIATQSVVVVRTNDCGNDRLDTLWENVRTRVAASLDIEASKVDLCTADEGRVTVSVASSGTAQETDLEQIIETVRTELTSAGASGDLQREAFCDVNIGLQGLAEKAELPIEAKEKFLESIAREAGTVVSNLQILHSSHAHGSSGCRSVTVRIFEPEGADLDSAATSVEAAGSFVEEAVADGSLTAMLKDSGVAALSRVRVVREDVIGSDHPEDLHKQHQRGDVLNENGTVSVHKPTATRVRLTEDGIVAGVPVVGAIARSMDKREEVIQHSMTTSANFTPPRQRKRREHKRNSDRLLQDSSLAPHDMTTKPSKPVLQSQFAPSDNDELVLDDAGAALSPGSPEREEFLKRRARVAMQKMLAQIEEKRSLHSQKNAAADLVTRDELLIAKHADAKQGEEKRSFSTVDDTIAARRRLMNRPLTPLTDVPNLHDDAIASQNCVDTTNGQPNRTSSSGAMQRYQAQRRSADQISGEPRTPKLSAVAAKIRDAAIKSPGSNTKDAVSAILAQLHSMNDDAIDLSSWTGDLRDLGSSADDDLATMATSDAEDPRLSARSMTSVDSAQGPEPSPHGGTSPHEADEGLAEMDEARPAQPEATLLGIISDGQLCWRILHSVPWQQLRLLQCVSHEFRVASQVVLALRPQAICVGGGNRGRALRSVVAYDTECDHWSMLAPMAVERNNSAVVGLVPGAGLLVAGGYNGKGIEASAERFDIVSGRWMPAAPMPIGKSGCRGVLLHDAGIALVVGGYDEAHQTLGRVDAYDCQRNKWNLTKIPPLLTARYDCAACSLPGNRAVVAGGTDAGQSWLMSAEVYDHALTSWTSLPPLRIQRDRCSAVGLSLGSDGAATVLVLGGSSHPSSNGGASLAESTAEARSGSPPVPGIVDLNTSESLTISTAGAQSGWVAAPKLDGPRCSFGAVSVGGAILAIGGDSEGLGTVERLRLNGRGRGGWEKVAKLPHPRVGASAGACPMAAPP